MLHWIINLINSIWFWVWLSLFQTLATVLVVRAANESERNAKALEKQLLDLVDRYGHWVALNEGLRRDLESLKDLINDQGA